MSNKLRFSFCRPKLTGRNKFTLSRQLHRYYHGRKQFDRKECKWLGVQHWKLAGAARAHPQSAYSALHRTTPIIESCFDLLEKAMQSCSQHILEKRQTTATTGLGLAHLPVKHIPIFVNSARPNHQASKDVCSHVINALDHETIIDHTKHIS